MPRRRLLLLVVPGLTLCLAAFFFFFQNRGEAPRELKDISVPPETASAAGEDETRTVVLYFLSDQDGLLHPEQRTIPAGPAVEWEARRLIEELIKGSRTGLISPLPPESELRQVFMIRGGTAVVDFSKEFADRHPSGSTAEMTTIYCLVNSLTRNFSAIKQVFFLVNGNERETLNGHISLAKPFLPLRSLIAE
ncbi:MAG: GerMN domain-containing protein [Candidatus Aminicenantes bacterium]|nr:GerMN domain-containing protein [Candidatus Aminicenantes bacterium]